jgi:hypothetical protein
MSCHRIGYQSFQLQAGLLPALPSPIFQALPLLQCWFVPRPRSYGLSALFLVDSKIYAYQILMDLNHHGPLFKNDLLPPFLMRWCALFLSYHTKNLECLICVNIGIYMVFSIVHTSVTKTCCVSKGKGRTCAQY